MKDNLGNEPNLTALESSILNKTINPGISRQTKDGRTVITCQSIADANALQVAASTVFPSHEVVVKKPKKSIIRIVGFKSQLSSESFTDQLFDRNPSFKAFNNPGNF